MTKQTKKADKPSKAGAVELTEERLDTASVRGKMATENTEGTEGDWELR